MASTSTLRVARAATRFVLKNSKEMGAKIGVVALATTVAGAAFYTGLDGPEGAELATNTLKAAGGLAAGSLGAVGFGKLTKNPLKALYDWSRNEPLSVLVATGRKSSRDRDEGERYLAARLASMSLKHRQQFNDFTKTQHRLSGSDDFRVVQYQNEIDLGLQAYRRVSMGMGPSPAKGKECPRGATYTP